MEPKMNLHDYVSTIRYFISISHDEMNYSFLARRVMGEAAQAMITSYRVDDDWARLIPKDERVALAKAWEVVQK